MQLRRFRLFARCSGSFLDPHVAFLPGAERTGRRQISLSGWKRTLMPVALAAIAEAENPAGKRDGHDGCTGDDAGAEQQPGRVRG